jgi:hypothetical protein
MAMMWQVAVRMQASNAAIQVFIFGFLTLVINIYKAHNSFKQRNHSTSITPNPED